MIHKSQARGFTLIETLLGLTIFSIIALSLYGTFRSGVMINRREGSNNRIYRQAYLIFEGMAKDLESARAYNFTNSYPQRKSFSGKGNQVTFLSVDDQGLISVTYSLQPPEYSSVYQVMIGKHTARNTSLVSEYTERVSRALFVREENLFFQAPDLPQEKKPRHEILSANVREGGLHFSYPYGQTQGGEVKVVWKDVWEEDYPPAGIKVSLDFIHLDKSRESGQAVTLEKIISIPTGFLGQANIQN